MSKPPELQKMNIMPARPVTCAMCATAHGEHEAHNFQSLLYGMRFKMKYGRDPTHGDTVAHLPPKNQAAWMKAAVPFLKKHGIEWNEPPEGSQRIAEPYAISE